MERLLRGPEAPALSFQSFGYAACFACFFRRIP